MRVVAGIDIQTTGAAPYPIYNSLDDMVETPQVVADFSRAASMQNVLDYCLHRGIPAMICSTGHDQAQKDAIVKASESIPVYFSYNNSLGVALMKSLIAIAARVLGEAFDIEIIEKHHNRKADAPSGTAVMLLDALNRTRGGSLEPVYDRHAQSARRRPEEVGMLSFRGGTLAGEHSVFFAGKDELLEIRHSVSSREVFAAGTLRAMRFMARQKPGLYGMDDVLGLAQLQ